MAERVVLQDFLARLGFEVHQPSLKAFLTTMKTNCVTASALTAGIVGVGVAAEAMAAIFARSSEKLYYSSQRVKASAGNLQAYDYAAKQIGVDVESARASVESLAAQLRLSPATGGLLEMLGVTHEGRDRVEVLLDTIGQLKNQFSGDQYFVGASFARSLGMDERTYLMLSERVEELRKFYADRKNMSKAAGVDADAAAAAGQQYMRVINELWEKLGLLGDKLKIELLEPFKDINKELSSIITQFTSWLSSEEGRSSIKSMAVHFVALGEMITEGHRAWEALKKGDLATANKHDAQSFQAAMYMLGMGEPTAKIKAALEAAGKGAGNLSFNASPGVPDLEIPSDIGARLSDRDMENLGFLWTQLHTKKWDQKGRDALSTEIDSILNPGFIHSPLDAQLGLAPQAMPPMTVEVNSQVTIHGATDPDATGRAVAGAQQRVFADVVRNLQGSVR